MKYRFLMIVLAGMSVGSLANATVTYTWSFGSAGASGFVAQGTAFAGTNSGGNIKVYSEQVNSSGVIQSTPATCSFGCSDYSITGSTHSTLGTGSQALFQVNGTFNSSASNYHHGTGIAPYDPAEGHSTGTYGFDNQAGINDTVPENVTGSYSNILELDLSGVANGTTLNFLLQGPTTDPFTGGATAVEVFYANATTPQNLGSMTVYNNSVVNPFAGISPTGTTTTFSLTKTTTNEFVAIQADCHYLLLDTITGTPGTVPEPSFYGFFAVAMVGLVIGARKLRARAAQQA